MSHPASCSLPKHHHHHSLNTPTVVPAQFFLSREDAEDLWKALHADKVDTKTITEILAKRSLAQRLDIVNSYKSLHSADLVADLKSKLSGDFKNVIVAMMTPLDKYYAEELNYAIAGLGTDEADLIEILCTVSNSEIKAIRRAYHQNFQVNLEDDIKGDTSGDFLNLLVSLCRVERDEYQSPDQGAAAADANAMYNAASNDRWKIYSDVLVHRSYPQLRLIFNEFEKLAGKTVEKSIQDNFSGDARDAALAIVDSVKNQAGFFAKKLHQSMAGLGTSDRDLVRAVVTRSEIDMGDIKREYVVQFSTTLADDIKGDTSGDYRTCLLTLIGEA